MKLYSGIDLHSNNHVVVVIDEGDRRVLEKRVPNELAMTLKLLEPHREALQGIAVESTFNWYWLVDGLLEAGYSVRLVNTAAVRQYEGLKHRDDQHDAFWLAHRMRWGILPTGYIYPKTERAVRDLLRRRMRLVQLASGQQISVQSQLWRSTGVRVAAVQLRRPEYVAGLRDAHEQLAVQSGLRVYHRLTAEIERLEAAALAVMKPKREFQILQTMRGIGPVLGLLIALETGDIGRFAQVGDYASYCRCVNAPRLSHGKKKGEGNAKAGNKYLSGAWSRGGTFCAALRAAGQALL